MKLICTYSYYYNENICAFCAFCSEKICADNGLWFTTYVQRAEKDRKYLPSKKNMGVESGMIYNVAATCRKKLKSSRMQLSSHQEFDYFRNDSIVAYKTKKYE